MVTSSKQRSFWVKWSNMAKLLRIFPLVILVIILSYPYASKANTGEIALIALNDIRNKIENSQGTINKESVIASAHKKFFDLLQNETDDSRVREKEFRDQLDISAYTELWKSVQDAGPSFVESLFGGDGQGQIVDAIQEFRNKAPEFLKYYGFAEAEAIYGDYIQIQKNNLSTLIFGGEFNKEDLVVKYAMVFNDFVNDYINNKNNNNAKNAAYYEANRKIVGYLREEANFFDEDIIQSYSKIREEKRAKLKASTNTWLGYLDSKQTKRLKPWFEQSIYDAVYENSKAQAAFEKLVDYSGRYESVLQDNWRTLSNLEEEIVYDVVSSGGSCRDLLKYNAVGYWTCVRNKNGVRDRALAVAERQRQIDRVSAKSAELNTVLDELFDKAEAALISRNLPAYEEARALYDATRKELEALYIDDAEFVEGNVPIRRWSEEDRGWTGLRNKYTSLVNRRNLMNEMASSCDLSKLAGALNQGRMSRDLYNWNYDRCLNWARKLKAIPEGAVGFFFVYDLVTGRNTFTESSTSDEEILSLVGSDGPPHSDLALEFLEHSRDPIYSRAYRERSNYSFTSSNGQPVLTSGGRFANTTGGNLAHLMSIHCRRETTGIWSFSNYFPPLPVSERCKDWARQYFELGGSMELLRLIIQADSDAVEVYSAIREKVRGKAVRKILAEPDLPNANDDEQPGAGADEATSAGADEATSQGRTCDNSYGSEWWEINCPK